MSTSPLSEWQDITSALEEAASHLECGELLHNDDFSLQRTMTAVVVGSDRMDTGSREDTEDPYLHAKTDAASVKNFSLEEQLGTMDRLMTLQASYHEGTGLGRSVYTCLFLFNLDRLREEDGLLYEFCFLLVVSCATVRDLLLEARVCEDEDFNILTHGLPSVPRSTPIDDTRSKAEEACISNQKEDSEGVMKGLLCRVRFQRYLLLGLRCVLIKSKASLLQAARYFTNAQRELKMILSTAQLGTDPPQGFHQDLNTSGQHMRFSRILSDDEVWPHFEKLLEELRLSTSVVHVGSYRELMSFLLRFASRQPGPIARSALYLQLDDRKQRPAQELPKWVPSQRMVAETLGITPSKLKNIGKEANYFLEQAMIGVQNLICCYCLNPFRQRRRLKRSLEDWHHLYDHAQRVDTSDEFHDFMLKDDMNWPLANPQRTSIAGNPGRFSVWCERETCRMMLRHLLLGFEQDLYQPDEFLAVYWYCDYLLTRTVFCTKELFSLFPTGETPTNKKQAKARQQAAIIRGHILAAESDLLEIERSLCQGLTRLLLALKMRGVIEMPELPFSQEQNRFEQRFLCFWILDRPEPLDYQTYQSSTAAGQTDPSVLLMMAARFFGEAKGHCVSTLSRSTSSAIPEETQTRVEKLEKVAKTNAVAANVLDKLTATGAGIHVRFNFEVDPQYPCIAISR